MNGAIFPDAAYIVFNSTRACANRCTFVISLSSDSTWLSKQLKNGSNRPRAEAADRGKHACPDGELQIAENSLEGGASLGSR